MKQKIVKNILRILIVVVMFFITICAYVMVDEIKSNQYYTRKVYRLEDYVYAFDNKEYYLMYKYTLENEYNNQKIDDKILQYEAFARYYNALIDYHSARVLKKDTSEYVTIMNNELSKISWVHILDVIDELNTKYKENI